MRRLLFLLVALLAAAPPSLAREPLALTEQASSCVICTVRRPVCGQLASCDQAYFHLRQCGHAGLDANRNGVPCEKTHCGLRQEPARSLPTCPIS
jgi:hypothetical protein